MTEKEIINKLIEEHKALFEATDMDVAMSMKGRWYFSRYNEEFDYYDAIASFKTAKELATILLGEIALDIFTTIDGEMEEPIEYKNLADELVDAESYKPHIERLIEYLKEN